MELIIVRGLSLAGIYFLIAFGVTFLYGVGGFPNLAIGPIGLTGAYVTASLLRRIDNIYLAVLSGVVIAVLLGVIIQRFIVEPLFNAAGGADRGRIFVIYGTFGLTLLFPAILLHAFQSTEISMRLPEILFLRLKDTTITGYELLSVIIAVVLFIVVDRTLVKTRIGGQVRAVTQNASLTRLIGVRIRVIYLVTAAIASLCSYIGAVLWGQIYSLDLGSGMMFTLMGFIVAVIGGLGSIYGAFVVSLILGLSTSFTSYYIGGIYENIVTTLILMLVLIVAPHGIVPTRREV